MSRPRRPSRATTPGRGFIHAYGLFWSADEVNWTGRGQFRLGASEPVERPDVCDFRPQRGIYILHDDYGPDHVGLTTSLPGIDSNSDREELDWLARAHDPESFCRRSSMLWYLRRVRPNIHPLARWARSSQRYGPSTRHRGGHGVQAIIDIEPFSGAQFMRREMERSIQQLLKERGVAETMTIKRRLGLAKSSAEVPPSFGLRSRTLRSHPRTATQEDAKGNLGPNYSRCSSRSRGTCSNCPSAPSARRTSRTRPRLPTR